MAEETARIPLPEEPLSLREIRLERAANVLRGGAIVYAALTGLILVVALIGGLTGGSVFSFLHKTLLVRNTVQLGDDAAVAVVVLLALLDLSLLLVLMVGALAREIWALGGVWVLAGVNLVALLLLGFTPSLAGIVAAVWGGVILSRDTRAFRTNPVMLKELRGRMRGMRAFVVITVYLGLMSGFATLIYLVYVAQNKTTGSAAAGEIGRVLFMGIVGIELLLIIFIAPAFTAGAITSERERQTYDLLRTTLLASPSFVIGKLESALGYILLLLLAAVPLQSIAFLFGGVSELELILSFVILAVAAIALGTVGIYFSAIMPRTLTASVRAYTVTLVVMFGVPTVLNLILGVINNMMTYSNSAPSPVVEAILRYLGAFLTSMNPVTTALVTQELLVSRQVLGFWTDTLSNGDKIPMVSPWITYTIIYLALASVLTVLAIRQTRKVEA